MRIGIIGLGYVGLPLFLELDKKILVHGYDHDQNRVKELKHGIDRNSLLSKISFRPNKKSFSSQIEDIKNCNIFIVTLPTPVDKNNQPNIENIKNITYQLSKIIKNKDLIIYESTFFPGLTNDILIPILEKGSQLKCRFDSHRHKKYFSVGYSPERVNPGDSVKNIRNIKKIISATNKNALKKMEEVYSFVDVGLFKTSNIKAAEASKVIENIQRDINIALMNELSKIFNKMNIDTTEVIEAASTKWNFMKLTPGFVGGHCIGIDPYYLAHKAKKVGIKPKIILQGRNINESMSKFAANKIIDISKAKNINEKTSKVLIMGFSFKENCNDIRNSKIFDLYKNLKTFFYNIDIYDPYVNKTIAKEIFDINLLNSPKKNNYDVIIVAVKHDLFKKNSLSKLNIKLKKNSLFFDLKKTYPKLKSDFTL